MILRRQKAVPLTADELDDNFQELFDGIASLKKQLDGKPLLPEGIKAIEQSGDVLHFVGTYGSDFGSIALPKIAPTHRGDWKTKDYYIVNDWCVFKNKTYACIKNHVATTFDSDQQSAWRVVIDPVQRQ